MVWFQIPWFLQIMFSHFSRQSAAIKLVMKQGPLVDLHAADLRDLVKRAADAMQKHEAHLWRGTEAEGGSIDPMEHF